LAKLANNEKTAKDAAYVIVNNFGKLPDNIRNLLSILADNKEFVEYIKINFIYLPENLQDLIINI
jgi:hypothetical protein